MHIVAFALCAVGNQEGAGIVLRQEVAFMTIRGISGISGMSASEPAVPLLSSRLRFENPQRLRPENALIISALSLTNKEIVKPYR